MLQNVEKALALHSGGKGRARRSLITKRLPLSVSAASDRRRVELLGESPHKLIIAEPRHADDSQHNACAPTNFWHILPRPAYVLMSPCVPFSAPLDPLHVSLS